MAQYYYASPPPLKRGAGFLYSFIHPANIQSKSHSGFRFGNLPLHYLLPKSLTNKLRNVIIKCIPKNSEVNEVANGDSCSICGRRQRHSTKGDIPVPLTFAVRP